MAEWQTRYFEGVVILDRVSSSLTSRTIPSLFLYLSLYAVVAELADALSSGGSGFIRESSNLSNRTSHSLRSHLRMRFFCEEYFSSLMI